MTRTMMRGAALSWLVIVLIAGSYLAWRVETGLTFRTDLMALLPMDEQDAAMQRAQVTVTQALSRQIVLLAGHAERYPDTAVRYEILSGDPAPLLASAARHARCLVVGSRGRGGFRGMLLGSTSRDLVNRTACPLLVAPSGTV